MREVALAELLELAPGGVEEVDLGDAVEYAVYGAARRAAGAAGPGGGGRRRADRGHDERAAGRLVGALEAVPPPARAGRAGSPCGRRGSSRSARTVELVIDPGAGVRDRRARDDAAVPRAAARARGRRLRSRPAARPRLRLRRARDRRREARLRAGDRGATSTRCPSRRRGERRGQRRDAGRRPLRPAPRPGPAPRRPCSRTCCARCCSTTRACSPSNRPPAVPTPDRLRPR